jgi:sec-independent protein translocase protein TatB
MFDLTSSKLLILALVALVVVGPKDLPVLLRTVGKYLGMARRQANEFRAYFDEAMREQEIASLRDQMSAMKRDVEETVSNAGRALETDVAAVRSDLDGAMAPPATSHPTTADADPPTATAWTDPGAVEPPPPAAAPPAAAPPEPAPVRVGA